MKKIVLAAVITLAGCANSQATSPAQLSEKYVNRMEQHYAGKQSVNRASLSAQANEILSDIWQSGRKDREDGMNEDYAQEQVDYYKNYAQNQMKNIRAGEDVSIGLVQFYATMAPEMAEAYRAGYSSK